MAKSWHRILDNQLERHLLFAAMMTQSRGRSDLCTEITLPLRASHSHLIHQVEQAATGNSMAAAGMHKGARHHPIAACWLSV